MHAFQIAHAAAPIAFDAFPVSIPAEADLHAIDADGLVEAVAEARDAGAPYLVAVDTDGAVAAMFSTEGLDGDDAAPFRDGFLRAVRSRLA